MTSVLLRIVDKPINHNVLWLPILHLQDQFLDPLVKLDFFLSRLPAELPIQVRIYPVNHLRAVLLKNGLDFCVLAFNKGLLLECAFSNWEQTIFLLAHCYWKNYLIKINLNTRLKKAKKLLSFFYLELVITWS